MEEAGEPPGIDQKKEAIEPEGMEELLTKAVALLGQATLTEKAGTGSGLTVTLVEAVLEQPLASVTVTVYVPEAAVEALGIEGFCELAENPLGPVHE